MNSDFEFLMSMPMGSSSVKKDIHLQISGHSFEFLDTLIVSVKNLPSLSQKKKTKQKPFNEYKTSHLIKKSVADDFVFWVDNLL